MLKVKQLQSCRSMADLTVLLQQALLEKLKLKVREEDLMQDRQAGVKTPVKTASGNLNTEDSNPKTFTNSNGCNRLMSSSTSSLGIGRGTGAIRGTILPIKAAMKVPQAVPGFHLSIQSKPCMMRLADSILATLTGLRINRQATPTRVSMSIPPKASPAPEAGV